ncbi:MAG: efflux RND transporter permease subunit, partial [Porphyromonas sp.]|nr:efflux RND transporter permease subunit [Porphyromonas sp.]
FVGSLMLMPLVKTEFLPDNDQGYITGTIELPQGYSKEKTLEFANMFSAAAREKYPKDLTSFSFTVGQADEDNVFAAFQGSGSNIISVNILMPPFDERSMTTTQLAQKLREELATYPVVESFNIKAGEGFGGSTYPVQLEIYGHSFEKTNKLADQFVENIRKMPACSEVNISRKPASPEYNVVFDDEKLAMYGLTKTTAASSLRNAITGVTSSYFREDGREYTIKVRYAQAFREDIESIENILITTPRGATIRLRDLGVIEQRETPPTIERKDRERYLSIGLTTTSGYAMSDLVAQSKEVMSKIELPEGTYWKLAGQFETQQESFGDLFTLMTLIILLVFIVMAAEFESFVDPFVIMFSVPFALSGVILGLVLTGTPMGVMALIGGIMLIGIVVKNGIVLIDYTILCRERGEGILSSVVSAGKSRLRPVLMTTATTVLGMLPLAFGKGEGAELWKSMGMTVAFGLTMSTLITLIIVPTVYAIFAGNGIRRKRRKLYKKRLQESMHYE